MREFVCSICGQAFESASTDEQSMDEARKFFGDPSLKQEDCDVVCTPCYKALKEAIIMAQTASGSVN